MKTNVSSDFVVVSLMMLSSGSSLVKSDGLTVSVLDTTAWD